MHGAATHDAEASVREGKQADVADGQTVAPRGATDEPVASNAAHADIVKEESTRNMDPGSESSSEAGSYVQPFSEWAANELLGLPPTVRRLPPRSWPRWPFL
jgi:hypothetical protein